MYRLRVPGAPRIGVLRLGSYESRISGLAAPLWQVTEAQISALTSGSLDTASLLALGGGGLVLERTGGNTTVRTARRSIATGIADDRACVWSDGWRKGIAVREARTAVIASRALEALAGPGSGVTYNTDAKAGPDGIASAEDVAITSSGYANYTQHLATGTFNATIWRRAFPANGIREHQWAFGPAADASDNSRKVVHYDWERDDITFTGANPYAAPMIGSGWAAGVAALAQRCYLDLANVQIGAFPIDDILTAATRNGERLYHNDLATLLDGGRLTLWLACQPFGKSSEYSGTRYLLGSAGGDYVRIDMATRIVTARINGNSHSFATPCPAWSERFDTLEFAMSLGGPTLQSTIDVRKNGGAWTNLGTSGAPQGNVTGATLDILCDGTSSQLSALLLGAAAYPAGANITGSVATVYSAPRVVVPVGDSITIGASTLPDDVADSYPYKLETSLGRQWRVYNSGISGGVIADATTDAARVDALYAAGNAANVVVVLLGSNDINVGDSAATIQTNLEAYCAARRVAGWDVIVCSILPRTPFSGAQETVRTTVNAWLAANWSSFADAYLDLASVAELADPTDATYYLGDTVHPNVAGNAVLAAQVEAAVQALL
jgi:lysophospholipase L1-like esterase